MSPRICTADLPGSKRNTPDPSEALEAALNERVDNTRVRRMLSMIGIQRAVVERLALWENGRTIRIKFLDGDSTVQMKVRNAASGWEPYLNLAFEWVGSSEPADIRISFADQGSSWSYVGTDALTVPQSAPTMNYGWLYPDTDDEEYQRVVLHEFGHALGMHHEHMSPASSIPWDRDAVYAYYARHGWSQADVDWNVLFKLEAEQTNFSTFDPHSIMLYAIDNSLTIGDYEVGWNTELSDMDKTFMAKQYPRNAMAVVPLVVGGERFEGLLEEAADVDTFAFVLPDAATVIADTKGPTDTILTILGPNDPAAFVVADDDRGQKENARIVKKLVPGNYWLTVRHKDLSATGVYNVGIKRRK